LADALADERVAQRVDAPLGPGVLVRLQRITAGKNPAGNYVLEVGDDGGIRIARHSGSGSAWRTPLDVDLPTAPPGKVGLLSMRTLRKLGAATKVTTSPMVVEGERAKDGVYEVLTVPPDRQVVYENADSELLQLLRKVAGGA
jgi:hypothetical protein